MSKIEVNTVEPQCGTTLTVGKCNTSVNVPGSATVTGNATAANVIASGNVVKTNAVQASDAGNIISQSGTTITIGASGDTINLASGANQSGFGRAGSVDWQTGSIKTSTFTAANGEGYFVNTTGGVITVNLPAGVVGNIVAINDYARTSATNNITINSNGSEKIEGSTASKIISTNGTSTTVVYADATQGWKVVDTGEVSSVPTEPLFTIATGGTITQSGDYKIHTFTGTSTLCVSQIGNGPTNPSGGPNTVSYMVIAGGGGGGPSHWSGGGGAGGYREGKDIGPSYTASPLVAPAGLTITATPYPVAVGAGGQGGCGGVSTFSTITSAGGGWGGRPGTAGPTTNPRAGGSGAGGSPYNIPCTTVPGSAGNTPPVSPPQGNAGGYGYKWNSGFAVASGGGGGAGGAGGNSLPFPAPPGTGGTGGNGGNGTASSITGSPVTRAGGGGGTSYQQGRGGVGGPGGGGNGGIYGPNGGAAVGPPDTPTAGAANTGGGAGSDDCFQNTAGGSGIVVIRYKFQ